MFHFFILIAERGIAFEGKEEAWRCNKPATEMESILRFRRNLSCQLMGWADCDGQPRSLLQIPQSGKIPPVIRRDFACGRYVNHSSDCSQVHVVQLCI